MFNVPFKLSVKFLKRPSNNVVHLCCVQIGPISFSTRDHSEYLKGEASGDVRYRVSEGY
jgi:hypothetical protein